VLGAGGHAKVVISTLQACGLLDLALYDDEPSKAGTHVLGVEVRGTLELVARGIFGAVVIAIGDNQMRHSIVRRLGDRTWVCVVHPTACIHESVSVGVGTVVFASVTLQPDVTVGAHSILNTGAIVDHDCFIGDYAHVCPGVVLTGGVHVGEGALIGAGSTVAPGVRIGEWATVGAGTMVLRDVPAQALVAGNPGRLLQDGVVRDLPR